MEVWFLATAVTLAVRVAPDRGKVDILEHRDEEPCTSLSPSLVPRRLHTALARIEDADRCLDLSAAAWRPVAAERWEQARRLLAQVRSELEAALQPWAR